MKLILMLIFLLIACSAKLHAVVGNFENTRNLPGHIDLDPNSEAYIGPKISNVNRDDGVIMETPSALIAKYMINGRIDTTKIRQLIIDIENYRENTRIAFCQSESAERNITQVGCDRGFSNHEVLDKWDRKDLNIGLKYAVTRLNEAIAFSRNVSSANINSISSQDFLEAFFDALEIYQGIVGEDYQAVGGSGIGNIIKPLRNALVQSYIRRNRVEASNILKKESDSETVFYSPEQLSLLESQGKDISLLDPPDSGFWRKPKQNISEYNTVNYNKEEVDFFRSTLSEEEISDLLDPAAKMDVKYSVYIPKTIGDTPKIFVKFGNTSFKVKFTTDRGGSRRSTNIVSEAIRVVRDMEVHTETVANNLASALGFSIDGTYYKESIRLFFEDEVYDEDRFDEEHQRMMRVLNKSFTKIYNTSQALKFVKVDPQTGRKYLELRSVQLERAYDVRTDMNIGMFTRKGLGKSLKREHRGFAIFLAWLWDTDTKDSNTGLKMLPYVNDKGQMRYRIVFANSDMGATLASSRPNLYNFRLIRNIKRDENGNPEIIRLNFWRVFPLDIMKAVSFADARWMARMIGQLTEDQIYKACKGAGYPELIAKYYTGLMIKKRNSLLEALNLMGSSYVNTSGEEHTFTPLNEFTGSIEGYEEFFRQGFITDPDNRLWDPETEPFPRYWGAGVIGFKGEPQEYFIKLVKIKLLTIAGNAFFNFGLKNINISNQGLRFRSMNLDDTVLARDCEGKCFFQGFNAGVEGFIPWRFIIDNPDPDAKAPFLIVDMFRLGFFAGYNLQQNFGVDIPGSLTYGIGAKHFQVTEFIKIKPIEDIDEFFNNKADPWKLAKLNFRSARQTMINNLKEGEALIQSHYIGLEAQAKIRFIYNPIVPISPSISFQGNVMKANRVTFLKQAESFMLVGWDKIRQVTASLRLSVVDFFVRIPLLEAELKHLRQDQRTFKFNMADPREKSDMFGYLNSIRPNHVPQKYAMAQRKTQLDQRSLSFGFFQFYRRTSIRKRIRVDYQDFLTGDSGYNMTYSKEYQKSKVTRYLGKHQFNYKVSATMNSYKEFFAKVRIEGIFEYMTKIKFKNLLYQFGKMLPDNFVQFDPDAISTNFGTLELNMETIFSENGLRSIFSPSISGEDLCNIYSEINKLNWDSRQCQSISTVNRFPSRVTALGPSIKEKKFIRFRKKYTWARKYFWEVIKNKSNLITEDKRASRALESIVDVLKDNGRFDNSSMNIFLRLTKFEDYYRRATMFSDLESFPGKIDTISQDVDLAGQFRPTPSMLSETAEEEFELFSDIIHDAIREIFYNEKGAISPFSGSIINSKTNV